MMPVHDWRKVPAGIFHDFHNVWIAELRTALNTGILPADYYVLSEQVAGQVGPDVLTLSVRDESPHGSGVATVAATPPKVRHVQRLEEGVYARKRKSLVIRHSSGDRIVAIIEIMSPGNKASALEFRRFLDKAVSALSQCIHLLVVDLFPPTKRDPQGIHGAIMEECSSDAHLTDAERPLTLASYAAGEGVTAYTEPIAVGDELLDMPLFLDVESYVTAPLRETYERAFRGVPQRWREILEN